MGGWRRADGPPKRVKSGCSGVVREALWSAVLWHRLEALQGGGKPPHSKAFGLIFGAVISYHLIQSYYLILRMRLFLFQS